jgi:arginyl-tRNA synthetase
LIDTIEARFRRALDQLDDPAFVGAPPLVAKAAPGKGWDYQANCAMGLAKRIQKKPRDVAEQIKAALAIDGLCDEPEIAGPGFINLRLKDAAIAQTLEGIAAADDQTPDRVGVESTDSPQKVIVDYSCPNVAKQMHVGHLRSTIIGDVIARVLQFQGHNVVRQNHLGDWGLPLAMVVARWRNVDKANIPTDAEGLVDLLEDLYRQANRDIETNPDFEKEARDILLKIQQGDCEERQYWTQVKEASMRNAYLAYERLGVLLKPEDEKGESAYRDSLAETVSALDRLEMVKESEGAKCIFLKGFQTKDGDPLPIIIQKTDGAYLYATTDLAAIRYRAMELNADRIIYVTDARQKLHFQMLFAAAKQAGWLDRGGETVSAEHVTFGTVLGENNKPLKTRSGESVKLKQLLNEAVERAAEQVRSNEADPEKARGFTEEEIADIADAVGIGAVKYADLAQNRDSDYAFSWNKMLALDGNTAPYMMYAYARIRSIYRKALEAEQVAPAAVAAAGLTLNEPTERALAMQLVQLPDAIESVARDLKPNLLTIYLFETAGAFMRFYESCPVLKAESEAIRNSRLRLCDLTARALKLALSLLGIRVLERM